MKNRRKIGVLLGFLSQLISTSIQAEEDPLSSTSLEWVEEHDVLMYEDGVYIDSNKGPLLLQVIEYDNENHRYLVEYPCFQ